MWTKIRDANTKWLLCCAIWEEIQSMQMCACCLRGREGKRSAARSGACMIDTCSEHNDAQMKKSGLLFYEGSLLSFYPLPYVQQAKTALWGVRPFQSGVEIQVISTHSTAAWNLIKFSSQCESWNSSTCLYGSRWTVVFKSRIAQKMIIFTL